MSRLIIFFLLGFTWATTYHTISIDGDASDFDDDEIVLTDPPDDSYWTNNEIYAIYLTWDAENLYVACDYKVQDNALLVVIDAGRERGVWNINNLDWYPRNFWFVGMRADILIALWNADLSTGGVRELDLERTYPLSGVNIHNSAVSGDSGTIEVSLPWSSLYEIFPQNLTLKLVALIAGGDHSAGGESAPDNESIGRGSSNEIRTFLEVKVDGNGDGIPDDSVSPKGVSRIVSYPRITLKFEDIKLSSKLLKPGDSLRISFRLTTPAHVAIRIFNERGKMIREFQDFIGDKTVNFVWDGRDREGQSVPMGIYIIELVAADAVRKKFAVALIR
jgi:hypothetical protein